MGYGDEGDVCMLSNYAKLTPNCQSAVNDLFLLRQQYMVEGPHGRHGSGDSVFELAVLWFPVFGIISLVIGIVNRNRLARKRKYNKDTRIMLAAIEANPAMKAQRKFPFCHCSLRPAFRCEQLSDFN